ncbi:hypothetical protein [Bradyrhizobium sp. B120]|uniref:hypothetical protein n=1 Tax=Bradyrhizobium sp. B120 TaxID=3410088 RepID=UPI003B97EF01
MSKLSLKPLPSAHNVVNRREWVLARARCLSAGMRLILCEIDEIGIALRHDWITADQAASDLAALEQLPVHVAAIFLTGAQE